MNTSDIKFTSKMLGGTGNLMLVQYANSATAQTEQLFATYNREVALSTSNSIEDMIDAAYALQEDSDLDADLKAYSIGLMTICSKLLAGKDLSNQDNLASAKIQLRRHRAMFDTQLWATVGKHAYPELSGIATS